MEVEWFFMEGVQSKDDGDFPESWKEVSASLELSTLCWWSH